MVRVMECQTVTYPPSHGPDRPDTPAKAAWRVEFRRERERFASALEPTMLDPRAPEHEIAAAAQSYVGRVRTHLSAFGMRLNTAHTHQELAGTLNGLAYALQARPVADDAPLAGRIARMLDAGWWTRNLRRELLRENEALEHAQGRVRRRAACYVTDHAMKRVEARRKANAATLAGLEVVNETGEAFNLGEVAEASVSNPRHRRSELMVRCRGFEETAQYMGHEAVFLTITCPSRYHRFDGQGKLNAKWDGSTPKDAQSYLCNVWAKIRAEWKREGFAPYGFRVAEPHHDGCPHWHILLFAPGNEVGWFVPRRLLADRDDCGAGLVGVAGRHALADSPSEPGALKHRFTCERIDAAKGSATGYIAKYISKNIDGEKEDGDEMGLDFASGKKATDASKRVRTWASTWGIRQFQQIGGPSVTVWRELRRLGKDLEQPLQLELFEGPRAAADRALWALFWVLQGGPEVPRAELTLKPQYASDRSGKYGDEVKRVSGVQGRDDDLGGVTLDLVTRVHTWTVQVAGLADVNAHQAEWTYTLDTRKKHADLWESMRRIQDGGEADGPWTGVNNCTGPDDDGEASALRADYLRGVGGVTDEGNPPCEALSMRPEPASGLRARPPTP